MPERPGRGEHRLELALAALARALRRTRAPWMIIGGIAMIARGVRRLTTDIDAAVRGDAVDVRRLIAALDREEIRPRIPDAAAFAAANLVLLVRHEPTGVDLDVSLAWSSFELEALEGRTRTRYGRVVVPAATPGDLVVFKLVAGRPKDLEDAEALLLLHRDIDVAGVRRHLATLADLAGEPAIRSALELILERVRPVVAGQRRPTRTTPRRRRSTRY